VLTTAENHFDAIWRSIFGRVESDVEVTVYTKDLGIGRDSVQIYINSPMLTLLLLANDAGNLEKGTLSVFPDVEINADGEPVFGSMLGAARFRYLHDQVIATYSEEYALGRRKVVLGVVLFSDSGRVARNTSAHPLVATLANLSVAARNAVTGKRTLMYFIPLDKVCDTTPSPTLMPQLRMIFFQRQLEAFLSKLNDYAHGMPVYLPGYGLCVAFPRIVAHLCDHPEGCKLLGRRTNSSPSCLTVVNGARGAGDGGSGRPAEPVGMQGSQDDVDGSEYDSDDEGVLRRGVVAESADVPRPCTAEPQPDPRRVGARDPCVFATEEHRASGARTFVTDVKGHPLTPSYDLSQFATLTGGVPAAQLRPSEYFHIVFEGHYPRVFGMLTYALRAAVPVGYVGSPAQFADESSPVLGDRFRVWAKDFGDGHRSLVACEPLMDERSANKRASVVQYLVPLLHGVLLPSRPVGKIFLDLASALLSLTRLLQTDRWTESELRRAQRCVEEYLDLYEATVGALEAAGVVPDSRRNPLFSTSFPKFHELRHLVACIWAWGPVKGFSAASYESNHRNVLKPIAMRTNMHRATQSRDMLAQVTMIERLRFKPALSSPSAAPVVRGHHIGGSEQSPDDSEGEAGELRPGQVRCARHFNADRDLTASQAQFLRSENIDLPSVVVLDSLSFIVDELYSKTIFRCSPTRSDMLGEQAEVVKRVEDYTRPRSSDGGVKANPPVLRPVVEVLYEDDRTYLADVVMVFVPVATFAGGVTTGNVQVVVQWHRAVPVLGDTFGCDVTVVDDEFSVISSSSIVRYVRVIPQLSPVRALGLTAGDLAAVMDACQVEFLKGVDARGRLVNGRHARPLCFCLRPLLHVG